MTVFLRTLEQYQGVLFLTTNRLTKIDPAFESRIDFILPYEDLTSQSLVQVWRKFIKHVSEEKFDVTDDDIEELATRPFNGREVRNLIKSAYLLTLKKGKVTGAILREQADMRIRAKAFMREVR
jgi:SpoVK/Ycf46/Vps4 family AAA+-type ATPase